jgi:glycosyltransferase involved in cell wall biosynthesis
MQICFMTSAKGWGGGELLLAHLVDGIAATGHETTLVARAGSPMARWGEQRGLPLNEVPGRGRRPRTILQLRRWFRERRPDVLVLNDPHAISSGGLAAWRLGIPRVGIRHTVFGVNAWKHRWLTDHLVCVSQAAQAACLNVGIPAAMTTIIHCGLPAPQVAPDQVQSIRRLFADASAQANFAAPARHLLGIGSLISVKGFDTTIRAVAQAARSGRHWHLWLAGAGADRAMLEKLAAKLKVADRVHLLGFRDDVTALLAAADLFVSASHSEGLPLVLVEAMQAGCPIAATPVGGCVEALQVDAAGVSPLAELFAPGNVAAAVAAIDRAVEPNPVREARIAAARQWAGETFDQQRMAQRHEALYRSLAEGAVLRDQAAWQRPAA